MHAKTLALSSNLKTIGNKAFYKCGDLESLQLPDSVKSIGEYSFYGCTNLSTIAINVGITEIPQYAFAECLWTLNLILPSGLKTIGDHAFYKCAFVSKLSIPMTVTTIGPSAFELWEGIKSVKIPASVKTIGVSAFGETQFYDTDGITALSYANLPGHSYSGDVKKMVRDQERSPLVDEGDCGNGVRWMYYSDGALDIVKVINSTTAKMDDYSFDNPAPWAEYEISKIGIDGGITNIGSCAFVYCGSVTEMQFPDSIEEIGDYAFYRCISLVDLVLPKDLKTIGREAFAGCTAIEYINFPSVKTVGDGAFEGLSFFVGDKEVEPTAKNLSGRIWEGLGDGLLYTEDSSSSGIDLWIIVVAVVAVIAVIAIVLYIRSR